MRLSGEEHKLEMYDSNEVPDVSRTYNSKRLDTLNKIKESIQIKQTTARLQRE